MTYIKNENKATVTLTEIEQHIIVNALMEYARKAYQLTGNIHHTEAAEKISEQFLDMYCEETTLNNN